MLEQGLPGGQRRAPARYPPGGGMARPDHITVRDS